MIFFPILAKKDKITIFIPTVGLQVLELVDADELKQLPDKLAKLSDLTELTIRYEQTIHS